ncbi:MAG: PIN domain nuclease [Desulfobacteraceae bacterium]|nr:PIN domain nuclease [Desulfobacteraceae bacterium]
MMVLVDTTVWIDFFSAKLKPHVKTLEKLIADREDICLCGVILTEILQGIRDDSEFQHTKELLANLIFLPMRYSVYLRSAEIYRNLRRKGVTIRKSVDCMIAAVAIEHDIFLLHNDKDFHPIEIHFGLKKFGGSFH